MKKSILLALVLLPLLGFTQVGITVGNPYAVIDASQKYYFHHGDELLTVKVDGRHLYIQKFNGKKLSFIKVRAYDDMPDDYVIERVAELNKRFYVFYSLWDKRNKWEQLFVREIDFKQGTFIGNGKCLIKVEGEVMGWLMFSGFFKSNVVDLFDFYYSRDSSRVLIQYRLKPEVKNDAKSYDIIGMNLFDKNLEPVWNKEIKMPYTEKKMNNIDYSVDYAGNAYILTIVYNDNTTDTKKSRNGNANYHIELLKIQAKSGNMTITPMKVEDKFLSWLWLDESPQHEMLCVGFYNNGKDWANTDGILAFKVNQEGKIYGTATYEIPVDILNQYASRKTQRKNKNKEEDDKAEFEDLRLRKVLIQEDGSLLIIGEQYFVKTPSAYPPHGSLMSYDHSYHYNDILITKVDATGKLAWMKKLPKRQVGVKGRGAMSYEYMYANNNHYLLFLDNIKNMELPLDKVPAAHEDGRGGFLMAYKLNDASGAVNKMSILDTREVKGMEVFQFQPSKILPLYAKEFVFEVYKKDKEDVFIKVILN